MLGLAAAFLLVCAVSLATPSLLGEEYDLARHAISLAKFAWYATLLPATVLLVRSTRDLVPLAPRRRRLERRRDLLGAAPVPRDRVASSRGSARDSASRRSSGSTTSRRSPGAALVVGAIGVALGDGRPAGRRWSLVALATGALGVVLSGAMTGGARAVARGRGGPARRPRGGRAARRARALALAGVIVARDGRDGDDAGRRRSSASPSSSASATGSSRPGVESYAHRTLLAYIGGRIWLDRPVTGVGWQASSEEWAYGPFLDDARARFPSEPDQAFPSPEHPWGIQMLYLQVAADLGVVGIALLLGLAAAAVAAGIRGLRSSPAALVGLGWLCVAAGVWTGIGLVAGLPLEALTWIAFGLVTVRE